MVSKLETFISFIFVGDNKVVGVELSDDCDETN